MDPEAIAMINACYQCGRCSGGCPVVREMDYSPRALLRHLQLGRWDQVLFSKTIWLCAGCYACAVGCPRGVDLTWLMSRLRQVAMACGLENLPVKFYQTFVSTIVQDGLLSEPIFLVNYARVAGWQVLAGQLESGWEMFLRGKIPLRPVRLNNGGAFRRALTSLLQQEQATGQPSGGDL
ncbi:MAG: 4Fe-4S dicluster domain-containing protein [Firmicutes bacterium]|nr:4Fe-4S dicluster domain-containing protein [Bacillota bacterium]